RSDSECSVAASRPNNSAGSFACAAVLRVTTLAIGPRNAARCFSTAARNCGWRSGHPELVTGVAGVLEAAWTAPEPVRPKIIGSDRTSDRANAVVTGGISQSEGAEGRDGVPPKPGAAGVSA